MASFLPEGMQASQVPGDRQYYKWHLSDSCLFICEYSIFLKNRGVWQGIQFSRTNTYLTKRNPGKDKSEQFSFLCDVTAGSIMSGKALWYISLPSYWPICSQTNSLNMCSVGPLAATLVPDAAEQERDFVAGPRHFVSLCYLLGHVHTRCPSRRHTESQKRDLFQSPKPHGCSHFVNCSSNRGQQGAMAWGNVRVSLPI